MTWTITIPPVTRYRRRIKIGRDGKPMPNVTRRLPPSRNSFGKSTHWAALKWWTDAFKRLTWALCLEARIPRLCRTGGKALITVRNFTCQPLDRDNFYTAIKPIIDGIVAAKVVPDDSDDYVDVRCENVRVRHKPEQKVTVEIGEIPASRPCAP